MNRITFNFLFLATALSAQTPTIIRGPYLQSPGPNSIIIRWRTDIATDSRVTYGLSFGSSTFTSDNGISTTEHRAQLDDLSPHTKYYYIIGSTTQSLRGPDSLLHFTTAPDSLAPMPVRLWAIGDFGHGSVGQALVRESYIAHAAATRPADLWLWLGDNVYQDGTDLEFQTKVFDSIYGYHHLFPNLPFASTSGNHDYNSICPWQPSFCTLDPYTHTGPYLDLIDPPTHGELGGVPSNLKIFYSFDYGDIHFISLNSEIGSSNPNYDWLGMTDLDTTFTSPMIEWLKADLAASTKKWKIAFWHQPPYSVEPVLTEYQPYCTASRHHFNPILEQYGVDLVLCGHDHSYQRSYLINGHYGLRASFTPAMMINGSTGNEALDEAYVKYTDGPLAGKGTVYVVEGNSSSNSSYVPVADPAIYKAQLCDTCIGSFFVDIDGDRLDAHFLNAYGEILDQFTILKHSTTGINDGQSVLYRAAVYPNPFNDNARIVFHANEVGNYQLELIDLLGKKLLSENINVTAAGKQDFYLDALQLLIPRGSYIVKIVGGKTRVFASMVKM